MHDTNDGYGIAGRWHRRCRYKYRTTARPAGSSRTNSKSVGKPYIVGEAVGRGARPTLYNLTIGPMSSPGPFCRFAAAQWCVCCQGEPDVGRPRLQLRPDLIVICRQVFASRVPMRGFDRPPSGIPAFRHGVRPPFPRQQAAYDQIRTSLCSDARGEDQLYATLEVPLRFARQIRPGCCQPARAKHCQARHMHAVPKLRTQKSGLLAVGTNASFFPAKNSKGFSAQAISGHSIAGRS
jgi:hypothetical protein